MSTIDPRGNNTDKSYKERLLELRAELAKAVKHDILTPDLFQLQLLQILNGAESIKIKSQREVERLTRLIGEEQGRIRACSDMADLIVSIVSAFNTQEERRLEEEQSTKDASIDVAVTSEVVSDDLPPGVKIIPTPFKR